MSNKKNPNASSTRFSLGTNEIKGEYWLDADFTISIKATEEEKRGLLRALQAAASAWYREHTSNAAAKNMVSNCKVAA
jgi:hypothetical protein